MGNSNTNSCTHAQRQCLSLFSGSCPTDSSRMESLKDWCTNSKYLLPLKFLPTYCLWNCSAEMRSNVGVFLFTSKYNHHETWMKRTKKFCNLTWGQSLEVPILEAIPCFLQAPQQHHLPLKLKRVNESSESCSNIVIWAYSTQAFISTIWSCHAHKRRIFAPNWL